MPPEARRPCDGLGLGPRLDFDGVAAAESDALPQRAEAVLRLEEIDAAAGARPSPRVSGASWSGTDLTGRKRCKPKIQGGFIYRITDGMTAATGQQWVLTYCRKPQSGGLHVSRRLCVIFAASSSSSGASSASRDALSCRCTRRSPRSPASGGRHGIFRAPNRIHLP